MVGAAPGWGCSALTSESVAPPQLEAGAIVARQTVVDVLIGSLCGGLVGGGGLGDRLLGLIDLVGNRILGVRFHEILLASELLRTAIVLGTAQHTYVIEMLNCAQNDTFCLLA